MQKEQTIISNQGLVDKEFAIEIINELFFKYDRSSRDQKLDYTEIINFIQDANELLQSKVNPSKYDLELLHGILDVNKDGKVTREDLINLALPLLVDQNDLKPVTQTQVLSPNKAKQVQQQKKKIINKIYQEKLKLARQSFWEVDIDRSGYIDEEEDLQDVLQNTFEKQGFRIDDDEDIDDILYFYDDWIGEYNINNDGKLSVEQYEQFICYYFEKKGEQIYEVWNN